MYRRVKPIYGLSRRRVNGRHFAERFFVLWRTERRTTTPKFVPVAGDRPKCSRDRRRCNFGPIGGIGDEKCFVWTKRRRRVGREGYRRSPVCRVRPPGRNATRIVDKRLKRANGTNVPREYITTVYEGRGNTIEFTYAAVSIIRGNTRNGTPFGPRIYNARAY